MTPPVIGLLGFVVTVVLIFFRVPVAVAMSLTGIGGFTLLNGWNGTAFVLGAAPFGAVFPYNLSVVPLFILMGIFAAQAGLSRSLYDAVNAFTGHLRGGLAMATIGAAPCSALYVDHPLPPVPPCVAWRCRRCGDMVTMIAWRRRPSLQAGRLVC